MYRENRKMGVLKQQFVNNDDADGNDNRTKQ